MTKLSANNIKKILIGIGIIAASITAHLTYKEATVTNTGLPNIPDSIALVNIKITAEKVYEPCRNHFKHAIYIGSFYRSEMVNRAVGGQRFSQHVKGEAMDMDADRWGGLTNQDLYNFIRDSLIFDQLIMEGGPNGWVHVSYSSKRNRHQAFYINKP